MERTTSRASERTNGPTTEFARSERIFAGYQDYLPRRDSRLVQVYLSSTATDMLVERILLMQSAVPYLRKYCHERGLEFQLVDMRSGLHKEMINDIATIEFSQQELVRCQSKSQGPNFVALLGDKYGHRPLPAEIELSEFKLLKSVAMKVGEDISPLLTWYLRDDNAVPPVYCLQPVTSQFENYLNFHATNVTLRQQAQRDWSAVEEEMTKLFRVAAEQAYLEGNITKETRHKYFQSVTDKEVSTAVLAATETKDKVVCFLRTLVDLDLEADIADIFIDVDPNDEGKIDLEAEELRERLRLVKIPAVLGLSQVKKYNVPWSVHGIDTMNELHHVNYMRNFGEDFVSIMEKMITVGMTAARPMPDNSLLSHEVFHHLQLSQTFCKTFFGCEDLLDEIRYKVSFYYGRETRNASKHVTEKDRGVNSVGENDKETRSCLVDMKDKGNNLEQDKVVENADKKRDESEVEDADNRDRDTRGKEGKEEIAGSGSKEGLDRKEDDKFDGERQEGSRDREEEKVEVDMAEKGEEKTEWPRAQSKASSIIDQLSQGVPSSKERLDQLGVKYQIGDTDDDTASDPSRNPRKEAIALPVITEYTRPLIMHGEPGCGKSTLVAKVMELSKIWFPESVSIVRFLGTSTMSSCIREVLVSLCLQVGVAYKVSKPTLVDADSNFQFLVDYLVALLWQIDTKSKPLVILLDGLDHLSSSNHAHTLRWLPKELPPNVHFLVSMATSKHGCLKNAKQLFPEADQYIEVPSKLSATTATEIMTTVCLKAGRQLTRRQKLLLIQRFEKCSHPVYVKLLVDLSLSWHSYTTVHKRTVGKTLTEAITLFFERLEQNHSALLLTKALGYLCVSKDGLSEAELEDLLSLDDDVLKELYVYHLPVDTDAVRVPTLPWRRLLSDIRHYLFEKDSGGRPVLAWQHQRMAAAAKERYTSQDSCSALHQTVAEYFAGVWSKQWKPIEFTKAKRGSFPRALRQVPAQPIRFTATTFNTRKLVELPYQLVHSNQFSVLYEELFCSCEWLYAKCQTLSLTALLDDFQLALDTMETEGLLPDSLDLFTNIRLVYRLLYTNRDCIRKDPVNLPIQVLSHLGPDYRGNNSLELLVQRTVDWCKESNTPMLCPALACKPSLENVMLFKISVELGLQDDKTGRSSSGCMCYRDDVQQLLVVQRQQKQRDKLCVFDLHDHGICIVQTELKDTVHSIKFVADYRYLVFRLLAKQEKSGPVYCDRLYESSTANPVTFPHQTDILEMGRTGRFIAYASGPSVYACRHEKLPRLVYTLPEEDHLSITALLISPDENSLLVEASNHSIKVFAIPTRKLLHAYENCRVYVITRKNILLCTVADDDSPSDTLVLINLTTGVSNMSALLQRHDLVNLHMSHDYLLLGSSHDLVSESEDVQQHAEIYEIVTCKKFGASPVKGPYTQLAMFGVDSLNYVAMVTNDTSIYVLFAGYSGKFLSDAVCIQCLKGHSEPVFQVIITTRQDQLLSASADDTICVWDLRQITGRFKARVDDIRKTTGFDLELEDVVSRYELRQEEKSAPLTKLLVLHEPSKSVFTAASDGKMRQLSLENSSQLSTTPIDAGEITHMLLSRSKELIILGGSLVVVWTVEDTSRIKLTPRKEVISCMAEANNVLVAGHTGIESLARVWNIVSGDVIRDIELLYSFSCVAIDSVGSAIVSTLFDFPVIARLEDREEEEEINMSKVDTMMSSALCVAISPNDKLAASASLDGSVRVISMTGTYLYRMQQKSKVMALTFTSDSRSLLSAGYRSIYVWSTRDGSLRYKLTRHLDYVLAMKFDDTGRFLVTTSHDRQLILWDFRRSVSMATVQAHSDITVLDIARRGRAVTFVPDDSPLVGILRPNRTLKQFMKGHLPSLNLDPTAQAVALTFSSQRLGQGHISRSCNLL